MAEAPVKHHMDLRPAEKRLLASLSTKRAPVESLVGGHFSEVVAVLKAADGPLREGLVHVEEEAATVVKLAPEGLRYKAEGLPERRVAEYLAMQGGQAAMNDLGNLLAADEVGRTVGWLKKKGWARMEKDEQGPVLILTGDAKPGADEAALGELTGEFRRLQHPGLEALRSRGLLVEEERTRRYLSLTPAGVAARDGLDEADLAGEEVTQVDPGLVAKWAALDEATRQAYHLRGFDLGVAVAPRYPGKSHPLTQMMSEIRAIFVAMGFQEIAGDYVESAYWNMDALFIPQDHPARDMQDTFYLDHPATQPVPDDALERARDIHERGGDTGSTGWGGRFDEATSRKALLRTHTTNTTVRYLAGAEGDVHKVFGIGKVFRKETMDATHLPEFYQIEGIVTEPEASFNMLVGLCKAFFGRMGFDVRFRPAYFPYTEPSMEIDVFHNGRWMELGGCGVFRPEVTDPLGVAHPVLAWGFGLERLAMMRLGLSDIRDLYISDVQWLREAPVR
jgi:phenylalanyl-tRNA synthetase alpha chain